MKRVVTFATKRPSPKAKQLVVERATLRSIADFADIEAMLRDGDIRSVVILGGSDIGTRAWADAVQHNAERG